LGEFLKTRRIASNLPIPVGLEIVHYYEFSEIEVWKYVVIAPEYRVVMDRLMTWNIVNTCDFALVIATLHQEPNRLLKSLFHDYYGYCDD
jgi:hypothetical protein